MTRPDEPYDNQVEAYTEFCKDMKPATAIRLLRIYCRFLEDGLITEQEFRSWAVEPVNDWLIAKREGQI